jgi:RND family efflux transporter MFP subunit
MTENPNTEEHHPEEFNPEWKEEIDLSKVEVTRRDRMRILFVLLTLIITPVILLVYHVLNPSKKVVRPLQTVQYVRVRSQDFLRKVTLPASIHSFRKAVIMAHVPGYLRVLNVDKGDLVRKGQVLAIIADPELRQVLKKDQAKEKIARLTFLRIQQVWSDHPKLISKERVQEKEASYKMAKAQVAHDEALMDYRTIRAPFDGMVTQRFVDPGKMISIGTSHTDSVQPIVTLERVNKLRAYVWVPAQVAPLVKKGQSVEVSFSALPGRIFRGTVTRFDFEENLRTRTMRTEIDFDNHDLAIHPGMYGEFSFVLGHSKNAILIPGFAIRARIGKPMEVVVVDHGVAHIRPIEVEVDNGNWVKVSKGLNPGDRVVVMGRWHVREGQHVHAIPRRVIPYRPARQLG